MNKILFSVVALTALSISFATQAQAAPRGHASYTSHGRSSYVFHGRHANYHLNYGTRFAHGFYYTGRHHNHWTHTRFDARYGTTCYYDPYCSTWYYWCAPASCYYPVSYCPYRTYCWGSGHCGGVPTPIVSVLPRGGQISVAPVGPVGPSVNGPVGPAGPGLNGPAGPSPNGSPVSTTQANDVPPIPAPAAPPRN